MLHVAFLFSDMPRAVCVQIPCIMSLLLSQFSVTLCLLSSSSCGLCNDAVIIGTKQHRVVGSLINDELQVKRSWPKRCIISTFGWRAWGKQRKTSVSTVSGPTEIKTQNFPNTIGEHYHYANPLDCIVLMADLTTHVVFMQLQWRLWRDAHCAQATNPKCTLHAPSIWTS